jgi:hypothetical protein
MRSPVLGALGAAGCLRVAALRQLRSFQSRPLCDSTTISLRPGCRTAWQSARLFRSGTVWRRSRRRGTARNLPKSEGLRKIGNVQPRLCSRRRAAIAPFQVSLRGRGAANRAASLASVRRPVPFPAAVAPHFVLWSEGDHKV